VIADRVIIKGWHDSGTIDGVYGPYSQAEAQWIYEEFLVNGGGNNWTIAKIATFASDEPPPSPEAVTEKASARDPASSTAAIIERAWTRATRPPAAPFGFGSW
jgi:hypothetical protein